MKKQPGTWKGIFGPGEICTAFSSVKLTDIPQYAPSEGFCNATSFPCSNVQSQFVISTLMCTFHPSGRPMASSHSPHLASETSLAAWKKTFLSNRWTGGSRTLKCYLCSSLPVEGKLVECLSGICSCPEKGSFKNIWGQSQSKGAPKNLRTLTDSQRPVACLGESACRGWGSGKPLPPRWKQG